jgi:hypothetical protein
MKVVLRYNITLNSFRDGSVDRVLTGSGIFDYSMGMAGPSRPSPPAALSKNLLHMVAFVTLY